MTVADIEPAPTVDSAQPWPGLDAFSEALSPYFFGRDSEAEDLFRRVRRDLATLLFGQSGLGKTSLLQAGLFPRLRGARFLPILVRLDHTGPLEPQVKAAIARECATNLAEATPIAADENLWEWLHRADRRLVGHDGGGVVPVLVFDQFEEMFTTGLARDDRRAESQAFLTALADLIENRPPEAIERAIEADPEILDRYLFDRRDYRIVIALREDFLAPLEGLRARAPSLGRNRYRLRPMAGHQGIEAILKPAPELVSHEVADQIIGFVGRANPEDPFGVGIGGAGIEVEPSLLSLVCRELNERRLAQGLDHIDAALLAGSRDEIIAGFYERTFDGQPPALRAFVEDELLSDTGYRELYSLDRAYRMLAMQDVPAAALDRLVERRLLRTEERLRVQRIEIIHDVLAPVIRKSREARHLREAEAEVRRREAEAERQRRAAEEAARRESEFRRERRRKRLAYAMLAVLAMLASGAGYFWTVAEKQSAIAEQQRVEAERQRAIAEQQRMEAERQRETADVLANLAKGFSYAYGWGANQDYAEALRWFSKAAEQGNAAAQMAIGSFYYYGQGVKQDYAEALRWFNKAAAQGYADAQTKIGTMYEHGDGVDRDYPEALRWYQKAADHEDCGCAKYRIGLLYQNGWGVKQDNAEALRWYQKAAEQRAYYAYKLGDSYYDGELVERNYDEALRWYRKAADQGDADAQLAIGGLYYYGHGVKRDYGEALRWNQKAADQGNVSAEYSLGLFYANGEGVPRDLDQARIWMRKAAAGGDGDAKEWLAERGDAAALAAEEQRLAVARQAYADDSHSDDAKDELLGALVELSWTLVLNNRPQDALARTDEALKLDPWSLDAAVNRAHALLLLGRYDQAKTIYVADKNKHWGSGRTFADTVRKDFAELREFGNDRPDMKRIEALLAK